MRKPYHPEEPKKEQVRVMFDRIAPRYDLLNHTLSLNIDRVWRRRMVRLVQGFGPHTILDVATGTGDLAVAMARKMRQATVVGVDLSAEMLAVAREKVARQGVADRVTLQEGDAEQLAFAEGSFDAVTVAFGVRNFGDLQAGVREMYRVLKPGGRLVILEFSYPRNPLFRALYGWYSRQILPRIGGAISHERAAYEYLPASVEDFSRNTDIVALMQQVGFVRCEARSQSWGIAHIYLGEKEIK